MTTLTMAANRPTGLDSSVRQDGQCTEASRSSPATSRTQARQYDGRPSSPARGAEGAEWRTTLGCIGRRESSLASRLGEDAAFCASMPESCRWFSTIGLFPKYPECRNLLLLVTVGGRVNGDGT